MNRRSGEESKKRILSAASRVFAEQGYGRANMRLIARSAGISVGGVYLYFKNKEELYLTLMRERMEDINRRTAESVKKTDDPREALRAFISISVDHATKNRSAILLQGAELGLSFGSQVKREYFRERRDCIREIIQKGIDRGIFRSCNAGEMAKIIFNMVRGYIVSMMVDEEALFDSEECIWLVLEGLSVGECVGYKPDPSCDDHKRKARGVTG